MAKGSIKLCLQCATCSLVSGCLCRALKYLSRRDSHLKGEAARWPKGKSLRLEIPGARGFTLTGDEKGFHILPRDAKADVVVRFKTPADAFRVFTGQIGTAQAYGEHRFTVKGNLSMALAFTRIVDRVEGYLFPPVIARRILKRLPKKEVSSARVYGAVLLGS